MSRIFRELGRFFRELKRRNVYKVAVAYLAVAFVGLQTVDLLIPSTTLPGWADELILAFLIVGFPVALVVAWAFEVTPDGVRRTPRDRGVARIPTGDEGMSAGGAGGGPAAGREDRPDGPGWSTRAAYGALVALGLVAGGVVGVWYLTGAGGGTGTITDRSVAVLPFETLGQREASAFTEGIHGGILTRLSSVSDLRVTSRTSVLRYRNPEASLPEIASELGVTWVVRGEVQESGNQVQVNARLVNAREDRQIWASSYRRDLTADDLFAIQEEIGKEITRELQARLTPAERRQVEKRPTESLEAYRLYVRGRSLLDQRTEPEMRLAVEWFRRAIARDSAYALAWTGLADALSFLHEYGFAAADSVLPEARRAVRRAVELDPRSAEAHTSLGMLHAADGEGPEAIRELQRAVELRPSYALPHSLMSWYYPLIGRPREGLGRARRAVELDPLAHEAWSNVALCLLSIGRPDSSLAPTRRARELQSEYSTGPFYEALAMYRLGRLEEAETLLVGLEVGWAPTAPAATLAIVRLASGDSAGARELLRRLQEEGPEEGGRGMERERRMERLFYEGLLLAALGRPEAAFDAFERVEGWGRSAILAWPNRSLRYHYPDVLDPLREDPRYGTLLSRLNRAWGLGPDGSMPGSM